MKFWNAMGAFSRLHSPRYHCILRENREPHPPRYHRIPRENADLFATRAREPLIPTLVERVYANRFTSESKQITLLFNARGHTVAGGLLAVKPSEGHHFFELLRCEELTPVEIEEGHAIGLKLDRCQVACIARLPRRLTVARDGNRLVVQVAGQTEGMRVVLADGDGKSLLEQPAAAKVALALPESATAGSQPVCVKLLGEKYLVDATATP